MNTELIFDQEFTRKTFEFANISLLVPNTWFVLEEKKDNQVSLVMAKNSDIIPVYFVQYGFTSLAAADHASLPETGLVISTLPKNDDSQKIAIDMFANTRRNEIISTPRESIDRYYPGIAFFTELFRDSVTDEMYFAYFQTPLEDWSENREKGLKMLDSVKLYPSKH